MLNKFCWNSLNWILKSSFRTIQRTGPRMISYSRFLLPTFTFFYYYSKSSVNCAEKSTSKSKSLRIQHRKFDANPHITKMLVSFLHSFSIVTLHLFRFFYLVLIFMPTILLYPLSKFKATRGFWLDCFVKSIERAGVVWIKAFQYISHRRDLVGEDIAEKFSHLREQAPTHSL